MATVRAWQYIYTNVEKEQSPHKKGGFQTLFFTLSGLTESEVEEMEVRLLYYPSESAPIKRLFFTTSTGKIAVAQIVLLVDLDGVNRGGRYLAHNLIFSPEDFSTIAANPFRVLRHFSFLSTVAEALQQGNFQTGDIATVSVEIPEDLADEAPVPWA
jgi:GTPase-associated protein 1, N-terminal domain type 2